MAIRTLAEAVTASFYAWEIRGRGWSLADYPVSLEPPHRPFFLLPQFDSATAEIDDGKRPTLLSRLFEPTPQPKPPPEPFEEEQPYLAPDAEPLVALSVRAPADFKQDADTAARLILALSVTSRPVSFELVGHAGVVRLQIVCAEDDAPHVLESITGYAPSVTVIPDEDRLQHGWERGSVSLVVDFGLAHEFFLPIKTDASLRTDPYIPLIGALADAGDDETVCLQILFEHVRNAWGRTILNAVTDLDGDSRIADAPEFVPLAKEKTDAPLCAAVVRIAVAAGSGERAVALARRAGAFFTQFARPGANSFIPLGNDEHDPDTHAAAVLDRESFRTGMLLSAEELAGLVHLPDASVRHPALLREGVRSKLVPAVAEGHALVLGENLHQGVSTAVTLGREARLAHMHVVGASGTGKSTFLLQLITQDIAQGEGIAVLDPHGDLIDEILARIPDERADDVVLFDPSDEAYPVGFNIMSAGSEIEKNLLASDLVGIFERLSTSWGDTMTTVLGNAILAILERPGGGTLSDLRRLLIDERFRRAFLAAVKDDAIRFFWQEEYPHIGTRSIGPLLTRLDAFLRSKLVRNIVSQRNARVDLGACLDEGRIVLAKLSQGLIGEANAALLGSLLLSKFHQLALGRQRLPAASRRPFFLYLDEFQHFVTPGVTALLAEGRKYGLGLVLAHQSLGQLELSGKVESAILSAHTRVVFRVSDADAKRLADGFSFFEAKDLQSLHRGEALVRIGSAANDCNLSTAPPEEVNNASAQVPREFLIARSRERFAVPVAEVELATPLAIPEEPVRERRERAPEPQETAPREPAITQPTAEVAPPPGTPTPRTEPKPVRRPKLSEEERSTQELGKGGEEHRYLQYLVKRLAEERGFRATIEAPLTEGRSIDVLLRRESVSIACEISVTTDLEHEIENLKKCAEGSFAHILFVSPDKRRRQKMAGAIKALPGLPVDVLAPEEILGVLDALREEAPQPAETEVRGYKVKVKRQAISYAELAQRRSSVAQVIANSLGCRGGA